MSENRKMLTFQVGDIVTLKKPHPCGSKEWKVLRTGTDIRLQCLGCGHMIMVPRGTVTKSIRGVRSLGTE